MAQTKTTLIALKLGSALGALMLAVPAMAQPVPDETEIDETPDVGSTIVLKNAQWFGKKIFYQMKI